MIGESAAGVASGENNEGRQNAITQAGITEEENDAAAVGLYRLCSATLEQLFKIWATFPVSSNLKQLLLF